MSKPGLMYKGIWIDADWVVWHGTLVLSCFDAYDETDRTHASDILADLKNKLVGLV